MLTKKDKAFYNALKKLKRQWLKGELSKDDYLKSYDKLNKHFYFKK